MAALKVSVKTVVFGNDYIPMLITFLESACGKNVSGVVGYANVTETLISPLTRVYEDWTFQKIEIENDPKNIHRNISKKMSGWRQIIDTNSRDGDLILFQDCDTIFTEFFDSEDLKGIDIGITVKDAAEKFRLNTGVVVLRNSPVMRDFVQKWETITEEILNCDDKLNTATSEKFPYGGGDQMALWQLLELNNEKLNGKKNVYFKDLKVSLLKTAEYNACENRINPSLAKIIHFKGAFHRLLLEGEPFLSERTEVLSQFQLAMAYSYNYRAVARLLSSRAIEQTELINFIFSRPRQMSSDFKVSSLSKMKSKLLLQIKKVLS